MAYELPPLPYDYTALEPYISKRTLEFHHDKHHAAYVNNFNAAAKGTELDSLPIEADFGSFEKFAEAFKTAATTQFGSGWAWLVLDSSGKLQVTKTPNADTP